MISLRGDDACKASAVVVTHKLIISLFPFFSFSLFLSSADVSLSRLSPAPSHGKSQHTHTHNNCNKLNEKECCLSIAPLIFWPLSSKAIWRSKVTIYNVTMIINQKIDSRWEIYQQHIRVMLPPVTFVITCVHIILTYWWFFMSSTTQLFIFHHMHSFSPQHFFISLYFWGGKKWAIKNVYIFPKKNLATLLFTHISERKNISCYQQRHTLSNIINDEGVVIKLLSMMNFRY